MLANSETRRMKNCVQWAAWMKNCRQMKQNIVFCVPLQFFSAEQDMGLGMAARNRRGRNERAFRYLFDNRKASTAAGIQNALRPEGHFVIRAEGREARPFFILSTFACSVRNPGTGNGSIACGIKKEHPDAIIVWDREWYRRQNAVLNMLRSKFRALCRAQSGCTKT